MEIFPLETPRAVKPAQSLPAGGDLCPHANVVSPNPSTQSDVNDHAPEFQNVPYHLEVDEVSFALAITFGQLSLFSKHNLLTNAFPYHWPAAPTNGRMDHQTIGRTTTMIVIMRSSHLSD